MGKKGGLFTGTNLLIAGILAVGGYFAYNNILAPKLSGDERAMANYVRMRRRGYY